MYKRQTEFFTLTVNGESHTYPDGSVFFEIPASNEFLFLFVADSLSGNPNSPDAFNLQLPFGNVGTYGLADVSSLSIATGTTNFSQEATYNCFFNQGVCMDLTAFEVNITVNQGVGGNLEGNLTGTALFEDASGTPFPNPFDFSATWRLPIQ